MNSLLIFSEVHVPEVREYEKIGPCLPLAGIIFVNLLLAN